MDEKEKSTVTPTTDNTAETDAAQTAEQTTEQAERPDTPTSDQTGEQAQEDLDASATDDTAAGDEAAGDGSADDAPAEAVTSEPAADLNARVGWLTTQLLTAKATAAATALGIPPEKAKYALRLADLSQIDVTAEDADKRIGAAMGQVVKDLPELAARQQQTTGTPGMFARQSGAPLTPFERGLNG